jgi:glycosyltransferase involved in cell wall biosynthesis
LNILVLYTEIAGYVQSSFEHFVRLNSDFHIHWVRYPVNSEAPFEFENINGITFYDRNDFSMNELLELASKINPQAIIVSGWIDKDYLRICKKFAKKCPTIVLFDNHWTGSKKQILWKTIFKLKLLKSFSHAWVPGKPQVEYALKLGFRKEKIKTGFYCADLNLYNNYFIEDKHINFPKRFVCVARYIPEKNLEMLWQAFTELKKEGRLVGWELWCLGTGVGFDKRVEHTEIKHLGFVQPKSMGDIIRQTSVFVLPSKFEPWAVAVHEFAAAGYPMIVSNKVGAASNFVVEAENGFSFNPLDLEDIKSKLCKFENMNNDEYRRFSNKSKELSNLINQDLWTESLLQILSKDK